MATSNVYLTPEDGWTQIATAGDFLRVSAGSRRPYFIAIADSTPSTASTPGTATLTFTGTPTAGETVTIGGITYTAVAALGQEDAGAFEFVRDSSGVTLAAAINGRAAIPAVAASGTITLTGLPEADDTVVVGETTFIFGTDVDIGADADETGENLAAAIVSSDEPVTAVNVSGVVTVTASTAGWAGNAIALTENATNTTVSGSGTLASGANLVPAIAANSAVTAVADANVITLTSTNGGRGGTDTEISESLTNVALSASPFANGAEAQMGIGCFGHKPLCVSEPYTGNVYARVLAPTGDTPLRLDILHVATAS